MSAAGLPRVLLLVFAPLAAIAASCGGFPSVDTAAEGAGGSGGQGGEGGQAGGTTTTPSSTNSTSSSSSSSPTTTSSKPLFQLQVSTSLDPAGSLALTTNLPALASDCQSAPFEATPCADLDQDGLTDAWEDIVLDRLRPLLRFDEDESLFGDSSAVVHDVGRVALVSTAPLRARAFIMLGYSRDYGSCGFTSHNGDSERVALDLSAPDGGGPGDVVTVGVYTAAHEGAATDQGRLFQGADLAQLVHEDDPSTGEPRWVVFPSQDKHATYATIDICEDISPFPCFDEDCAPDDAPDPAGFDLLPPIVNAGEDTSPLVTDLTAIGFPGDDAWADQDFCGGLGGSGCSSAVREKLLDDPF